MSAAIDSVIAKLTEHADASEKAAGYWRSMKAYDGTFQYHHGRGEAFREAIRVVEKARDATGAPTTRQGRGRDVETRMVSSENQFLAWAHSIPSPGSSTLAESADEGDDLRCLNCSVLLGEDAVVRFPGNSLCGNCAKAEGV